MNSTNSGYNQHPEAAVSEVEPLLKQVNIALKCLHLYPANHATTRSAIEKLALLLAEYFDRHDDLAFIIRRDALLIDGQPVGAGSLGIKALALQLYRLKLARVSIHAGIDRRQLIDLLMITCMDPDDVFKAGGVKELLWERRVTDVSVAQAFLKLDHGVPATDSTAAGIKTPAELTAYKAILSGDPLTEPDRQFIKRHLEEEPERLSGFLETLGEAAETLGGESAVVANALPKLDSVIKRELASDQPSLYGNLAEALTLLEEPVRKKMASVLDGAVKDIIPVKDPDSARIAARVIETGGEGLDRIKMEIAGINKTVIEEGALAVLSEVLAPEVDLQRLTHAASAVQRLLFSAFDEERLDVATKALTIAVNEIHKRGAEPDNHAIFKEITRNAGDQSRIGALLSQLENNSEPPIGAAVEYIKLIGHTGISTLLDMLAVEKSQGRRRLLCRVLTTCGEDDIAGLGNKIMDHRWYLVRNVVFILGQIGDAGAATYIQKTTSHPDPRVRKEAAKASSHIGLAAMPAIDILLNDKVRDVRTKAIRAIARINDPSVIEILTSLIVKKDFLGRQVDIKVEAIQALGGLKAERSIPLLMRITKARAIFFKARQARLSKAAGKALLRIKGNKNGG